MKPETSATKKLKDNPDYYVGEALALGRSYAAEVPFELIDAVLTGRKTILDTAEDVFQAWKDSDDKRPVQDSRLSNPILVYVAVLGFLLERVEKVYPIRLHGSRKRYVIEYSRDGVNWAEWERFSQHKSEVWFPHQRAVDLADLNVNFFWRVSVGGTPVTIALIAPTR